MSRLDPERTSRLIDDLAARGYAVVPQAISPALLKALRACFERRSAGFRPAKIGRSQEAVAQPQIRNDEICWLDEGDLQSPEAELFGIFNDLRLQLNRELFLGLADFEAHYARYDKGHFYSRHVDRFDQNHPLGSAPTRAARTRMISVVLYLNEDWLSHDGGQLRLHVSPPVDVLPSEGTLVCFTSADIEHEVLPTARERMSIAAWFRK